MNGGLLDMSNDGAGSKINVANPGALGLACFGFTTILLNLHNIGLIPDTMPVIWGFFWGGAAQIIAGLVEAKRGDTFGFTAFVAYGFFWVGLAMALYLQWQGVIVLDGPSLAWTMIVWGIFSLYMTVVSFTMSWAHRILFCGLTLLFGLLAGHFFGEVPIHIAGGEGIFVGAVAVYMSAATLFNAVRGRWVIPIGLFNK